MGDTIDISKNLNKDDGSMSLPSGSYSYALNMISNAGYGNKKVKSNEESNALSAFLPDGFVVIGNANMTKNRIALLLVNPKTNESEIGIFLPTGIYNTVCNDKNSAAKNKLSFDVNRNIQVEYRLRKGCEDTIYFTGTDYPVRYFNFSKTEDFKTDGKWDSNKFSLIKKMTVQPKLDSVEVLNTAGSLPAGSYSIMVQSLDSDFNGTEFTELVSNVFIYNSSITNNYYDVNGSTSLQDENKVFTSGDTTKAIKIKIKSVDPNFTYIRFAFIQRNTGTGIISSVKYSDVVSAKNLEFLYTGKNANTNGTIEDVTLSKIDNNIESASHLVQIDNMLVLGNTKGSQIEHYRLQEYASKIQADCFVKDVILTTIEDENNPKNPLVSHNGVGYQDGEVYSFGIVYEFENNVFSPNFHIPGKSSKIPMGKVYSTGCLPMSNKDNYNVSERYTDENKKNIDYWGKDCEGDHLNGSFIRHHRFPNRAEVDVNFVKRTALVNNSLKYKRIQLILTGDVKTNSDEYTSEDFKLTLSYTVDGEQKTIYTDVSPESGIVNKLTKSTLYETSSKIENIVLTYTNKTSTKEIPLSDNKSSLQENGLIYSYDISNVSDNDVISEFTVPIFGIKFSNIELPTINGKKAIGYKITRQERTDEDKTILDTGVIFPVQKSDNKITSGLLAPEFKATAYNEEQVACDDNTNPSKPVCSNVDKNSFMLLAMNHKFLDHTYDNFDTIEQVGVYKKEYVSRSVCSLQNVHEGTSAGGKEDSSTKDSDGFSLRQAVRFTGVTLDKTEGTPLLIKNKNMEIYNLQPVNYNTASDNKTIFNLSSDNKALIFHSTDESTNFRKYEKGKQHFPYVHIKRDNKTFYQNFRNKAYYAVDNTIFTESSCEVFGGDTYTTPMRYSNHVFGNAAIAMRRQKLNAWQVIGTIVTAALAIVLSVVSGGTSISAGVALIGAIMAASAVVISATVAVLETAKFTELYGDKWQKNLDRTVFDFFYTAVFIREYPNQNVEDKNLDKEYLSWEDDTFRWFGDIVGDLWLQTTLNVSLRVSPNSTKKNFLQPLKSYMNDRSDKCHTAIHSIGYVSNNSVGSGRFHRYEDISIPAESEEEWFFINKITEVNSSSSSTLKYSALSSPQVYYINPDYTISGGVKTYYNIPLEYDITSECLECFPNRYYYSQQSFQEETVDNYRVFKPNNYRDLDGETGEITNVFKIGNELYFHTQDCIYNQPRNFQERVTDQIISFIGTGSYFEVPPRKVEEFGGCTNKFSTLKTANGIFYVSEKERKIYFFNGKNTQDIGSIDMSNFFYSNIPIENNTDNCANEKEGQGFALGYDVQKNRVLVTKKETNTTNGWTLSFSLEDKAWVSFHSYQPYLYLNNNNSFYSISHQASGIYKHNVQDGTYTTFHGISYPFIVDANLNTAIFAREYAGSTSKTYPEDIVVNSLKIYAEVKKYNKEKKSFVNTESFFNKMIAYNSYQSTGLITLVQKDDTDDWFDDGSEYSDVATVTHFQRDYFISSFRNNVYDYSKPIFNCNVNNSEKGYYIDKVLNDVIDFDKDWTEKENLIDKYFGVRFILDEKINDVSINFLISQNNK